jgi:hypothetical protein
MISNNVDNNPNKKKYGKMIHMDSGFVIKLILNYIFLISFIKDSRLGKIYKLLTYFIY